MNSFQYSDSWKPVTRWGFGLATAFIAAAVGLIRSNPTHYLAVLDDANLAFHEAGHLFFGLAGQTLGLYGGTFGQLVFPIVAAGAFYRRRETTAFGISLFWLFENILNIGRYMGDARAQMLPLAGGGEHDWTAIFTRWGVLSSDTGIAAMVNGLGWIGIAAVWIWLAWRVMKAGFSGGGGL